MSHSAFGGTESCARALAEKICPAVSATAHLGKFKAIAGKNEGVNPFRQNSLLNNAVDLFLLLGDGNEDGVQGIFCSLEFHDKSSDGSEFVERIHVNHPGSAPGHEQPEPIHGGSKSFAKQRAPSGLGIIAVIGKDNALLGMTRIAQK